MNMTRPGARDVSGRTAGSDRSRRHRRTLLALGAVVLALAVTVGTLVWLAYRDSQVRDARLVALQTGREQVVTVLSYDFRTVDRDLQQARAVTTGEFGQEFTDQADQATAATARAQQIVTRASVIAASVVRAGPQQVVLLLFVNQTTQSSQSATVQVSAHRIELTMTWTDGRWLISRLDRV